MNRHEQRNLQRKAVAWYYDTPISEVSLFDADREHAIISGHLNSVIVNDQLPELLPQAKSAQEREKILTRTTRFLGGEAISAIAKNENVSPNSVTYTVWYALRRLGLRAEDKTIQ